MRERERERERERDGGERENITNTKNSWNIILSCYNPLTCFNPVTRFLAFCPLVFCPESGYHILHINFIQT